MENIVIDVGQLNSPTAFYFSSIDGLEAFNQGWSDGLQPSVCWDLRQLTSGKIDIGAVAFFLAVAHRVRLFTSHRQPILLEWHPKQFSFLSEIGFFETADKYDLFKWPFAIGGFEQQKLHPSTKVMSFDQIMRPPSFQDLEGVSEWKLTHREHYRAQIVNKCESLFSSTDLRGYENLPLIISRTTAELVTNSLLWGDSSSFTSFQRSRFNISINVCDIGRGFRFSLYRKGELDHLNGSLDIENDVVSIALGSVINENDFGLKRAIDTVLELGGNITILSNKGEIQWTSSLWKNYLNEINNGGIVSAISKLLLQSKTSKTERQNGYSRVLPSSIRGTRIKFYIPLVEKR